MNTLTSRMVRAARLDSSLYDEVDHDETATEQALVVVLLASLAAGVGSGLGVLLLGAGLIPVVRGLANGAMSAIFGWLILALVTYWIGRYVCRGTATYPQLLRVLGFAYTPGILRILVFVPGISWAVMLVTSVWVVIAIIIAIRQALDFSTRRAICTAIVGWLALMIVQIVFTLIR